MDNVVLVRSREDCKDLLDRFHHVGTTKPFPEGTLQSADYMPVV